MLLRLRRTYLAVFFAHPFLLPFAAITFTSQAAFALVNICAMPLYLVRDLHLSGMTLGLASATFLAAETLLKSPMGHWSDRIGRRAFVVLGPLVVCLNPVLFAALPAHLWFWVFPLRVADGVGAAALWPPLFAAVGDLVPDRTRSAAMSVMNTVYVGAVGGAAMIGALTIHLTGNDRSPFVLASVLLFASAAIAHVWFPRGKLAHSSQPTGPSSSPHHSSSMEERNGLNRRSLYFALAVCLLMSAGVLVLSNFLVLYLMLDMHLSPGGIGLLLAGLGAAVLALGLPLGHLADRWGPGNAVRLSLFLAALCMWVIPSCRTVATLAPVATILVLGHIMGTPAWLAMVSRMGPAATRGRVMGLVATGEGMGAMIGPILGGWLWDKHHHWIFYGSGALLTLAALTATAVLPHLPQLSSHDEPELGTAEAVK